MLFERTNAELLQEFNRRVYGHETAKKTLLCMIARARKRHYQKFNSECSLAEPYKILLIGNSGTGKTFMMEQLAKMLDFPLLKLDATQLSPGSGNNSTDQKALVKLFTTTINDWLERRKRIGYTDSFEGAKEKLVVYIDEIDKLTCSFESSGNWNKHIQNSLLSVVDNHDEWSGISFVFSGAFADMERDMQKQSIGFNTVTTINQQRLIDDDIIKHGLIPEFVGRLTAVVELDQFNEADYRHIMYEILLPTYRYDISDTDVTNIIARAIISKQGVRYLKRQLDMMTMELEFNEGDNYDVLPSA
jgi:ATP-dependent Clp protease ATP-binding subunit ClpX